MAVGRGTSGRNSGGRIHGERGCAAARGVPSRNEFAVDRSAPISALTPWYWQATPRCDVTALTAA